MTDEKLVKIAIPLKRSSWEYETVWAAARGGDLYEIRNVPWLADGIHHKDVVRCNAGDETDERPKVVEVVRPSGHDSLHVIFTACATDALRTEVLAQLERNLGYVERASQDGWAVDVNPGTDLAWALEYFGGLQAAGYLRREAAARE